MLTLPLVFAAISAGLLGGIHCVGMCGGISQLLSSLPSKAATQALVFAPRQSMPFGVAPGGLSYLIFLHGGRLCTYMLIGAMFGGLGTGLMRLRVPGQLIQVQQLWFFVGNLALIFLAGRVWGVRWTDYLPVPVNQGLAKFSAALHPHLLKAGRHPFKLGLSWGLLPCGLSFAIAPFALISGAAWSGAVLMLIFGLSALPHLLLAQSIAKVRERHTKLRYLRAFFALSLLVFGLLGLFYFDMRDMPALLCIAPVR